jgi:AcrR family transcriptional regulator
MADADATRLDSERLQRVRRALARRAWHEVTTEELADAAGLSRMTLHRRGITKDVVLAQLGELLAAEYRDAIFPALTSSAPAGDRLRQALEAACGVDERSLGLVDALGPAVGAVFHEPGDGPVLTRATFVDGLRRIVEDGVREGTVRSDDPAQTATLLFNATGWTYRHLRTGHRWSTRRARDAVVDLLLDGVRVTPAALRTD